MQTLVNIGKSVQIKGELTGNEDLTIDGLLEGKIHMQEHHLTVGANASITAEIRAKSVTVLGRVTGNIQAGEKVEIDASGTMIGDIRSPRVILADGSKFKGSVDMDKPAEARPRPTANAMPNDVRTAVTATPAPAGAAKA